MAGSSVFVEPETPTSTTLTDQYWEQLLRQGLSYGTLSVRIAAFWVAIVFPCFYLPLLFDGLSSPELTRLLAALCLHVCLFIVGHDYRQPTK